MDTRHRQIRIIAMKKITWSAVLLVSFIIIYTLYLRADANHIFLPEERYKLKLWNYYSLLFIISGIWFMEARGVNTFLQESILNGGKLLILLCFINIILTQHCIITNPYTNLRIFMAGGGLALIALLYELIKIKSKKWARLLATLLFFCLVFAVCST